MSDKPRQGRGGRNGHEPRGRIRSREMRALELSVQGFTQAEIAAELRVSQAAVSKILNRVETRILKDRTALVERQRTRQTLRLEHVYSEAMRAWEHSKGDSTRRRQRRIQDGKKPGPTIAELVVETEHGNPQFLEVGRKALADQRKLWGLNAPEITNVVAASPSPYSDVTDEELHENGMKLAQILMSWGAARGPSRSGTPRLPRSIEGCVRGRVGTQETECWRFLNDFSY
jgi:DNA-binding CsgD family transcriptional regulator